MPSQPNVVADAVVLRRWFVLVDTGDIGGVLGLLAEDFAMSMQLARGDGTAMELTGGFRDLQGHLARRGRRDLRHHVLSAATVDFRCHRRRVSPPLRRGRAPSTCWVRR